MLRDEWCLRGMRLRSEGSKPQTALHGYEGGMMSQCRTSSRDSSMGVGCVDCRWLERSLGRMGAVTKLRETHDVYAASLVHGSSRAAVHAGIACLECWVWCLNSNCRAHRTARVAQISMHAGHMPQMLWLRWHDASAAGSSRRAMKDESESRFVIDSIASRVLASAIEEQRIRAGLL
ncbi:hypothetical protein IE81DRAFT_51913 [Ceraceosorus guamensis]|uniref:Uncharacterized protein n=1 Tax=Ceraceosorus guamensis TaxID=1522189 RepID=A0A316W2C6_9BASI|nr:hypothetical protein IE81DRAFT_51913 [Ceraceosorus guamensis]PWN43910.1 hypothetical protein IE81DRAFT_51913 [Ceraceosorus guamensis]